VTWLHVPSLALPSAPVRAASNSAFGSPSAPPIELWVTSSGTPIRRPSSWRGWRTRPWIRLLSGTTSRPSMADHGAAAWISSLRGSPASPSRPPARAGAWTTSGGSGRRSPRVVDEVAPSLVFAENVPPLAARGLDHVLRDLADLGFDVEWSCLSAAAVGATHRRDRLWLLAHRDGNRLPGLRREPRSDEAARDDVDRSGGPAVADSRRSGLRAESRGGDGREAAHGGRSAAASHEPQRAGKRWPTPTAPRSGSDEAKETHSLGSSGSVSPSLPALTASWPTPQARDGKGAFTGHRQGSRDLPGQATGYHSGRQPPATDRRGSRSSMRMVLNPPFVEWLMGWPIGWTDCTRSATASCRSWRRTHSSALHDALVSSTVT
jgi:hypothetical protein